MGSKTPLYDKHVEAGARIVDFGGWDMPLNYGSQKEEHHAVRQKAGMFDVSHMTIVDLKGERVRAFLRYLVQDSLVSFTQMVLDGCHSTLELPEDFEWEENFHVSNYK